MSKIKMPEPVKYLYRIKCLDNEILVEYFSRDDEIIETIRLITTEQAEAYAQAVRDEALAEAAEIADRHNDFSTFDAIRALKEQS